MDRTDPVDGDALSANHFNFRMIAMLIANHSRRASAITLNIRRAALTCGLLLATTLVHASETMSYAAALEQAIQRSMTSATPVVGSTVCRMRISQLPGGEVVTANVLSGCGDDRNLSEALELAALRATPLPYFGHEPAFRSELLIDITLDGNAASTLRR